VIKELRSLRLADLALAEMVSLAKTLPNTIIAGHSIESIAKVIPKTFFGSGKLKEIQSYINTNEISLVLVDGTLSPAQQQNLEKSWQVKILDKTGLILEIFSDRAASREGVLQVELAALTYQRTRLVRAWTHLERQRGGLGFVGGPGETQIESDRRAIDDSIFRIKGNLKKVRKTRNLHRESRQKKQKKFISLVGYTNAGKSTIFNSLTGASVLAEDKLFATLDPTIRNLPLPGGHEALLSDTVGFISDLPTELVSAFSATLDEVSNADMILHVRDISHPETDTQFRNVVDILEKLGAFEDKHIIEVWNKSDLLLKQDRESLLNVIERKKDIYLISAEQNIGLNKLRQGILNEIMKDFSEDQVDILSSAWSERVWLYKNIKVISEKSCEDRLVFCVNWSIEQKQTFYKKFYQRINF